MKTIIFKPFEKYSERTLLISGILITLIGSLFGYWFSVRFDGVLDLHFVQIIQLKDPFLDNLINIFSLAFLLFPLAKYLNKKTRFIDILVTVMVARVPFYLFSLTNISGFMSRSAENMLEILDPQTTNLQMLDPQIIMAATMDNLFFIIVSSLIAILCIIWYIILLYNGFKTASHAKGTKPIVLFSIALIFAEILSKLIIFTL